MNGPSYNGLSLRRLEGIDYELVVAGKALGSTVALAHRDDLDDEAGALAFFERVAAAYETASKALSGAAAELSVMDHGVELGVLIADNRRERLCTFLHLMAQEARNERIPRLEEQIRLIGPQSLDALFNTVITDMLDFTRSVANVKVDLDTSVRAKRATA